MKFLDYFKRVEVPAGTYPVYFQNHSYDMVINKRTAFKDRGQFWAASSTCFLIENSEERKLFSKTFFYPEVVAQLPYSYCKENNKEGAF